MLEQYLDAVEKVKATPDSPSANAAIGKYLCFVREDWKAGLPALAKSNLGVSSLATEEMKLRAAANPIDAKKGFELAGRWWTAAEAKGGSIAQGSAIKNHAAALYANVEERLEGTLEKRLATSRLGGKNSRIGTIDQGGDTVDRVRQNAIGKTNALSRMAQLSRIEGDGYARLVQDGITLVEGRTYKFSVQIAGDVVLQGVDHVPEFWGEGLIFDGESKTSNFRGGWTTYEAVVTTRKTGRFELKLAL